MLVPVTLFLWPVVTVVLFMRMSLLKAMSTSMIAGWMFLPMAGVPMPFGPDYSKQNAVALSLVLGIAFSGSKAPASFRLRLIDVPMLTLCISPIITSLTNGLGLYDGLCSCLIMFGRWGIPYFVGRIFLTTPALLEYYLRAILIGVLVYVPLCFIEMILSPQLHRWVYGFHQHSFLQTIRSGGFRPMVFMQHGLMTSFWMTIGTLIAAGLWYFGKLKRIGVLPLSAATLLLIFTVLNFRSTGALILMVFGLLTLFVTVYLRSYVLLTLLLVFPVVYTGFRSSSLLPKEAVLRVMSTFAKPDKVGSLGARLNQEDLFSQHAFQRPFFGWGAWERNFPRDPETGRTLTRGVDGLWTIIISQYGFVGLGALLLSLSTPGLALIRQLVRYKQVPADVLPATISILVVSLFAVECLPNGMVNPVYILLSGGVASLATMPLSVQSTEYEEVFATPRWRVRRVLHPGSPTGVT